MLSAVYVWCSLSGSGNNASQIQTAYLHFVSSINVFSLLLLLCGCVCVCGGGGVRECERACVRACVCVCVCVCEGVCACVCVRA